MLVTKRNDRTTSSLPLFYFHLGTSPLGETNPLSHYHLHKLFVHFDSDRQYKHEIVENKDLEKVRFWPEVCSFNSNCCWISASSIELNRWLSWAGTGKVIYLAWDLESHSYITLHSCIKAGQKKRWTLKNLFTEFVEVKLLSPNIGKSITSWPCIIISFSSSLFSCHYCWKHR